MRLLCATLSSYRRFRDKTSVRLDERVLALVGPNEAGKTSVLRALTLLNDDNAIPPSDRTRRATQRAQISARFHVDDADKAALAEVPGADAIVHFEIAKTEAP